MRFGACVGTDPEKIRLSKSFGFDYVETNLSEIAKISDEAFEPFLLTLKTNDIPCEASNCFIPGEYKLVGDDIQYDNIAAYVKKALERASQAGIQSAVFGSGGARHIPEGVTRARAHEQLAYFLKEIVSPEAAKYGIRIAIEPLNKKECNCLNSVNEGVAIARATGCDNIKTLADLYHVYAENDQMEQIAAYKGEIIHAHVANPVGRCYPQPGDGFDYQPFFKALEAAGCTRCSVEAGTKDFENDAPKALAVLKML